MLIASLTGIFFLLTGPVLGQAGSVSEPDAKTLYSSTLWKKDSNGIAGMYRIVERDDGSRTLVLGRDFKTKAGPDLKLVLSPRTVDQIDKKNALDRGVVLGSLRSNEGKQEYPIPEGLDLSRFKSLAIHCEQYTKLWGASALSEGEVVAFASEWKKKTKKTKGGYEFVRRDDGFYIRFAPDFKTAKPPEPLRILLSPLDVEAASNKNAEGGAVFIAELRSIKGGQEYRLPDGIDPADYRTVLLNCKKYTKLWSAAALSAE